MSLVRFMFLLALVVPSLFGCGDGKTVIPSTGFTEEQKQAIKAEDAKVADEESHGKNKKK
jgi:hypothetical protein